MRFAIWTVRLCCIFAAASAICLPDSAIAVEPSELVLATTPELSDTGLLDVLIPAFESQNPHYSVRTVVVGSGAAIALANARDVDALLVNTTQQSESLYYKGVAVWRLPYFSFDSVLLGPESNPAGVLRSESATQSFDRIARAGGLFVPRSDGSPCDLKELEIWKACGNPQLGKPWYLSTATRDATGAILMAESLRAYTLTERHVWLRARASGAMPDLEVVNEGSPAYVVPCSLLGVFGARNREAASAFGIWMAGIPARNLVARFGRADWGYEVFKVSPGNRDVRLVGAQSRTVSYGRTVSIMAEVFEHEAIGRPIQVSLTTRDSSRTVDAYSAGGFAKYVWAPTSRTTVRARTADSSAAPAGTWSEPVEVRVAHAVSAPTVSAYSVKRMQRIRISGKVVPKHAVGTKVRVEVKNPKGVVKTYTTKVTSTASGSCTWVLNGALDLKGTWRFRATLAGDPAHATGTSGWSRGVVVR
ncbi:MAG: hypothetical protein U1E26_02555 [Coriobacteriia bacterium]|nr:hypothetical protein [Coriobacteriia bacterium]